MATKKLSMKRSAVRMSSLALGIGVSAALAAGCAAGGAGDAKTIAAATNGSAPTRCAANSTPITAISPSDAGGSTVALGTIGGKTVAYVADADAKSIVTFDVDAKKTLATTQLSGTPAQLLVKNDGRLAVTLRDVSRVQMYNSDGADKSLRLACEAATPAEPIGLAEAKDGQLVVASGWGRALTSFSRDLEKRASVGLDREPRSVVIEGDRAFVSHMVGGEMSVVDIPTLAKPETLVLKGTDPSTAMATVKKQIANAKKGADKESLGKDEGDFRFHNPSQDRETCQGFALAKMEAPRSRVFAPEVFVSPGQKEERTSGYGGGFQATEIASVAVVDAMSGHTLQASLAAGDERNRMFGDNEPRDHAQGCLLPRGAAVDSKSKTLVVACMGIDAIVAYDALAPNPVAAEKMRWRVAAGPNGLAIDSANHRAVVFSSFERSVHVVDLETPPDSEDRPIAGTALAPLANPLSAQIALGRALFHTTDDARVSKDGRACASCHPDGRDDALTWSTPRGPRRSVLLAGRIASTAPYSWNADEASLKEHVTITFDRLNGGGVRGVELDAILAYISTLPAPPPLDVGQPDLVQHGAELFASAQTGCAGCHTPGHQFTDGTSHDVGSAAAADRDRTFGTPSLRLISGTGPYFHDGRYSSLHDLLADPKSKMGQSAALSEGDRNALEAYVRTL